MGGSKATEGVDATVVHRERGIDRNVIEVDPELGVIASDGPRKIVRELITLFGALDVGIRLAACKSNTRNVHCDCGSTGCIRIEIL